MAKYTKDRLASLLIKHGYEHVILTPQWYSFALQLAMVEKLENILKALDKDE